MNLIIGLGNPGEKYKNNRHDVGHLVIDKLSQTLNSKSETLNKSKIQIFKSKNFMNDSGGFVMHLISKYPNILISDIYIIHDDLDIPLGEYKIQFGKGPKDHNGINSIEEALGTKDFWRVRIGIDNRKVLQVGQVAQVSRVPRGEEYVLQNFTDEERMVLNDVIKKIVQDLT